MNVSRQHLIGDYTNNIAYKARHKFVDTSTDCTDFIRASGIRRALSIARHNRMPVLNQYLTVG